MPFGLKNAPSAFQKAMVQIFEPILSNALVYIDDILLFSPDEDSHIELLSKFYSLVKKYGIMLSEKKMEVGVSSIDFLGMKISEGKYSPQPHIAQELHRFPDEMPTTKMLQQFLGLVNYMADFLPKLSNHTVWLFPMLKKNPPPWTEKQTTAVKEIKKLADVMPPLKIPVSTDKRILQTDASDDCWGAVLLAQDKDNVRTICGYKSGTFKKAEQHYHSTFKEILAVKRGIERFQFHLIGHEFQIEMDMSAFPRMLQFKRKTLPQPQLLRWANWFSQWKYTVKHIKGKDNVLADFLSRPKSYLNSSKDPAILKQVHTSSILPMVLTIGESSSSQNEPPSNNPQSPLGLPEEITETIADLALKDRAMLNWRTFLTILLRNHGPHIRNIRFHPDYPYLNVFHIHELFRLPKEALCFFWYLFESYTIGISFNLNKLLSYIMQCQFDKVPPHAKNLCVLLQWFLPLHQWTKMLSSHKPYVVVLFRRPSIFLPPAVVGTDQSIVYHAPTAFVHDYFDMNPSSFSAKYFCPGSSLKIRATLAEANMVKPETIPPQIMHDIVTWSDDHPISSKWMEAIDEYWDKHLAVRPDTSDEESEDIFNVSDPYEDDPSHPDSRWK